MTEVHRFLYLLSLVLLALLCLGMIRQRKLGQSVAFSLCIAVATSYSLMVFIFPDSNTPEAFMVKQAVYDSLLFAMALEIAYRAFAAFRGIADRVRALLAAAVALSTLAIFLATPANQQFSDLGRYQPAVTTAGLWCLTFVALLIVWYQIPVPPFTRAIMLGYVPYLVVFVFCMDMLARRGWSFVHSVNTLNAAAYDAAAGYLAYAAWRKD